MPAPDDLSEWSLHCFCRGARQTPHAVVRRRNHGRLLFETESWRSIGELRRAGLAVPDDSLRELRDFGLLECRGDRLRCAFPRLGPGTILPLRDRMGALASDLLAAQAARIDAIAGELAARGMSHALYAVLFGEVMDGLLWTRLGGRIALPDTRPGPGLPPWRGVFWAVCPPVPDAIGTNDILCGGAVMTLVWSQRTTAMLDALRRQAWPADLMRFVLGEAAAPPPQALAAGLVDGAGSMAVPVFGDPAFARLSQLAGDLAESAARHITGQPDALAFPGDLPAPQRNVIVLHEFIWAMQSAFGAGGAGSLPGAAPPTDERGSVLLRIPSRD